MAKVQLMGSHFYVTVEINQLLYFQNFQHNILVEP